MKGIPQENQILSFEGIELNEDATLAACNIVNGSKVSLKEIPLKVFVKMPNGETKTFEIKATDTINELKNKIQIQEGIPTCQRRVTVNKIKNDVYQLTITPGHTYKVTVLTFCNSPNFLVGLN